jgi:hypothetical protein
MILRTVFRVWLLGLAVGLALGLSGLSAHAATSCRIAFDIGSSGVRAGASNNAAVAHVDIDYLAPLWAGRSLEDTFNPTAIALKNLPLGAGFSARCVRGAAGFSAWRLAWQQAASETAALMARLQADTRVAVLVMPQSVEGAYAYASARDVLGARLATSHVLDIGGGSFQIAGARSTYGQALGQKSWRQVLCASLRQSTVPVCDLQPMSTEDLQAARLTLDEKFIGITAALEPSTTLTAISRPITRGVAPAVRLLVSGKTGSSDVLSAKDLSAAITAMATLSSEKIATQTGTPPSYAAYLLSDMLLLEGLLRATGGADIKVIEGTLSILPALLADDKAFRWSARYGCYLERFKVTGPDAYFSDPATCARR